MMNFDVHDGEKVIILLWFESNKITIMNHLISGRRIEKLLKIPDKELQHDNRTPINSLIIFTIIEFFKCPTIELQRF
jgi:hypothetical protein